MEPSERPGSGPGGEVGTISMSIGSPMDPVGGVATSPSVGSSAAAVVPLAGPATTGRGGRLLFRSHGHTIAGALAVVAAIVAWQLSGLVLNPIFISTPLKVAQAFGHLVANGQLPSAFARSLIEMAAGLVIATVVGVGIGLLMGRVRLVARALEPLVAFGNGTPTIALLPVMEVWFGFGTTARIAFIMVIAIWPVLVNTYAGVRAVSGRYTDVGKAFGLGGWKQTWKIHLPGTMPFIFAGLRISLAVGAVGMILGGDEIGQTGLGGMTVTFGEYSETADLIAAIVSTTALAMLLFLALRIVRDRAFSWIAATSAGRRR